MSPAAKTPSLPLTTPDEETPRPASVSPVPPPVPPTQPAARATPTVLVSAEDAYIHERMQSQPATLSEMRAQADVKPREGLHRLSLPDYFEQFSYDCSQGLGCKSHAWSQRTVEFGDGARLPRWEYDHTGKDYVFRWVPKLKRVLDAHINQYHWSFVNARYFPNAPAHLFTANGGVEVGGDILMFLPTKHALAIRKAPGQRSRELLKSRTTPTNQPGRILMGNPDNPLHYMPNVQAEASDEGDTSPAEGALVEGRDF